MKLIALADIPNEAPHWPFSPWATARLVRRGELGAVRVGRRVFVTLDLIDSFIARHTVDRGKAA